MARPGARPGRWFMIVGAVLALLGVAPIASAIIASAIAGAHGCRLDEGDAHPCLIAGHDWGTTLYGMGVAAWLALVTVWLIPIGLVLFGVGLYLRLQRPPGG